MPTERRPINVRLTEKAEDLWEFLQRELPGKWGVSDLRQSQIVEAALQALKDREFPPSRPKK